MHLESFSHRRIWRSLQWASQSAGQERNLCGHQDSEGWLYWQAEERLPEWSQYHGTVWPPKHNPPGRRCHQMYVHIPLPFRKLSWELTERLNTHFLSREMTDGTGLLITNKRKSVQDKSLIFQSALNGSMTAADALSPRRLLWDIGEINIAEFWVHYSIFEILARPNWLSRGGHEQMVNEISFI